MIEPIQECLRCGETLERDQQGKVLWCTRCQRIWEEGFQEGMRAFREMTTIHELKDLTEMMKRHSPFRVKR